jgi:hypothetical protein
MAEDKNNKKDATLSPKISSGVMVTLQVHFLPSHVGMHLKCNKNFSNLKPLLTHFLHKKVLGYH